MLPQVVVTAIKTVFLGELTDQWIATMPLQVSRAMDLMSETEALFQNALTLLIMTAHLRGVPFSFDSVHFQVINRCHHAPTVWHSVANFVASNPTSK